MRPLAVCSGALVGRALPHLVHLPGPLRCGDAAATRPFQPPFPPWGLGTGQPSSQWLPGVLRCPVLQGLPLAPSLSPACPASHCITDASEVWEVSPRHQVWVLESSCLHTNPQPLHLAVLRRCGSAGNLLNLSVSQVAPGAVTAPEVIWA